VGDGFYDPGRDTEPLPPLESFYRHNNFGREVILVDSESDIDFALAVQEATKEIRAAYVNASSRYAWLHKDDSEEDQAEMDAAMRERERVKILALYVCERMGFSSNVCDREGGSVDEETDYETSGREVVSRTHELLQDIKIRQNSNVVPLGLVKPHGTCRHRAILFKVTNTREPFTLIID